MKKEGMSIWGNARVRSFAIKIAAGSRVDISGNEELNSLAHRLIGKLIYTRMDSLGYFDEIKKELNLTETTKQIIKEDPQYFESIIQNVLK